MLLTDFKAEYRERVLALLWRQWTALGVSGNLGSWQASVIDPEALLLITCTVARSDPRLFDAGLEWLRLNGSLINIQRIKRILRNESFSGEAVLKAVAGATSTSVSQAKWAKLARKPGERAGDLEPLFFLSQGVPLPVIKERDEGFAAYGFARENFKARGLAEVFRPELPGNLLLRLRALFGLSARCEILHYLLLNPVGSPRAIARACYYFPATISKAMTEMSRSGFLRSTTEGRRRCYRLTPDTWRELFLRSQSTPPWVVWAPLFSALEQIWLFLHREDLKNQGAAAQASALRRVLKRECVSRVEGKLRSVIYAEEPAHPAEALIPFFISRTRAFLDWLDGECRE